MTALQKFAKWYRQQHNATSIGITGSYGKTTTRELINSVLSTTGKAVQNPLNYNNEIGVPLTLFNLESHHKFLIVEMGAAKPGDITPLTQITSPQIGIITGIGPAHLQGFQSIEQVATTKGDLLASLPRNGLAVLPGDCAWTETLKQRANCRTITVGLKPEHTYQATRILQTNTELSFCVNGTNYNLPLIGQHYLSAALSAIAVGVELGYSEEEIQAGFNNFRPIAGRTQIEQLTPWTVINDTYNANPVSSQAACELLGNWKSSGDKIFVLGDMLELGSDALNYHQQLGEYAARRNIQAVYAVGQYAKHVVTGAKASLSSRITAHAYQNKEDLTDRLQQVLQPGDVILVKGSRGMRMESIVETLKTQRFQDSTRPAA